MTQDSRSEERGILDIPLAKTWFLVGLFFIFICVYSQYVIPDLNVVSGTLIVYGIPILATGLISGRAIIAKALNRTYDALKFGLGYFGAFTVLGILLGILILFVLLALDPNAVNLLDKPNPVLQVPPGLAWVMVGFSFLVVGPSEEYLFRGFVFGGLLSLFKGRHWLILALISSVFFGVVHLYYAVVYGIASLVQFTDLITFGMAMAATYYVSGGNLLVPAIIHGAYDATGFIGVATSLNVGIILRESMTLISVIAAIAIFGQRKPKQEKYALETPVE